MSVSGQGLAQDGTHPGDIGGFLSASQPRDRYGNGHQCPAKQCASKRAVVAVNQPIAETGQRGGRCDAQPDQVEDLVAQASSEPASQDDSSVAFGKSADESRADRTRPFHVPLESNGRDGGSTHQPSQRKRCCATWLAKRRNSSNGLRRRVRTLEDNVCLHRHGPGFSSAAVGRHLGMAWRWRRGGRALPELDLHDVEFADDVQHRAAVGLIFRQHG